MAKATPPRLKNKLLKKEIIDEFKIIK